ncbi:MAG: TolC family protein, partial [Porticoccus sp.]|nr:TolC family protein [Porticoccus sp.]
EKRQAFQQFIQLKESHIGAQRNTVQQARSQHLQVLTNRARVNARNQAITSAKSALEATQAGYEAGTRNIVDVLIAQRGLYQAKRDYANARYDYIGSLLRLKEVAGQLSPDDIHQLNAWLDPAIRVTKAGVQ